MRCRFSCGLLLFKANSKIALYGIEGDFVSNTNNVNYIKTLPIAKAERLFRRNGENFHFSRRYVHNGPLLV